MSILHLGWNPVGQQLDSLQALVEELRRDVMELRAENAELRREAGYWKSMHARAVERNTKLQGELDEAKAEIRQLKAERFKRYRRTCKCTDQPQTVTAALPPKLLPKSIYGTSVWVHLLLEKFQLRLSMCSTRLATTMCRNHTSAKRSQEC